MNTFEGQIDLKNILNRRSPVIGKGTLVEVAAQASEIRSSYGQRRIISNFVTLWGRWLAQDTVTPAVMNFPLAFTAFITLTSGVVTLCCGCAGISVWLAVTGFLITSLGAVMWGLSLAD